MSLARSNSKANVHPEAEATASNGPPTTLRRQPSKKKSGTARETISRLSSKFSVLSDPSKRKNRAPMLTSSQLSDLFSRLDRNGDGELDLDEFTGIIKMLKINTTADYIARVFRSVDQARGGELAGTLDMQEFIAAYQKIYCGAPITELEDNGSKRDTFVRATRYGYNDTGAYLFECYTIPSDGIPEKHVLGDLPTMTTGYSASGGGDKENLEKLSKATTEPWTVDNKPGTIDNLDRMIRIDSARNKTSKAKVLWWIDVACSAVDRTTAEELVAKFGLPNNSKFISSFGNFGNGLPADPKSRIFAGNGIDTNGSVYSLSFFAQAQYIQNVPVVHHLPAVLRQLQCFACNGGFFSQFTEWVVAYYTSRFAWMANLSWLAHTPDDEKIGAYERAEGLASLLWMLRTGDPDAIDYEDTDDEDDEDFEGDVPHAEAATGGKAYQVAEEERPGSSHTIFSSSGGGVPIRRRVGYIHQPTWLRSNSQLYTLPPHVSVDSLGLHILDQGYGSHTLLTVRQIDSEKQKKLTLEQQSRAGVLGRIISGVWVKLAEVIMKGRSAGLSGEMADSPGTLATFVLMLIHNFSMNSVAPVDYWLNLLEKEIKDIVVSKHSAHLAEVERVLKDFNSYLDPLESAMQALSQEQEEILSHERELLMAEQLTNESVNAHSDSEAEDGDQDKVAPLNTRSPQGLARPQSAFGRMKAGRSTGRRRTSIVAAAKLEEALPEDVEKISLSYAIIAKFFGQDPYREIHRHLEGYEQMEIKGLVYWKERLKKYSVKVEGLKGLIATQLDEKRNFMSFMLTIITTILAPLAILTGYFGMNFTNMYELDPDTAHFKPGGVSLMWLISGLAYALLLMFALHFRVLYSAT